LTRSPPIDCINRTCEVLRCKTTPFRPRPLYNLWNQKEKEQIAPI
jgi:hypothetical protein